MRNEVRDSIISFKNKGWCEVGTANNLKAVMDHLLAIYGIQEIDITYSESAKMKPYMTWHLQLNNFNKAFN